MRVFCLLAIATVAGCSAQPAAEPGPSFEPGAKAGVVASAAEPAAATAVNGEYKPPAGYRKRVEGGQTYYCMKTVVLGSRFPKEDCRTESELKDMEMQRASVRGEIEQQRNICGAAAACNRQ